MRYRDNANQRRFLINPVVQEIRKSGQREGLILPARFLLQIGMRLQQANNALHFLDEAKT